MHRANVIFIIFTHKQISSIFGLIDKLWMNKKSDIDMIMITILFGEKNKCSNKQN